MLLPNKDRKLYRRIVSNKNLSYLERKALRSQIVSKTKKITICPHCGELNGVVKKCGPFKIVHDKYRSKKETDPIILQMIGMVNF